MHIARAVRVGTHGETGPGLRAIERRDQELHQTGVGGDECLHLAELLEARCGHRFDALGIGPPVVRRPRPERAVVGDSTFRVKGPEPDGQNWAYAPDAIVRCEAKILIDMKTRGLFVVEEVTKDQI